MAISSAVTQSASFEVGISGFHLRESNPGLIEKWSPAQSAARLARQCEKQRLFSVHHPAFRPCEVVGDGTWSEDGAFSFLMPHYRFAAATDFVDHASVARLKTTWSSVCELVAEFVARSPVAPLPRAVFLEKGEAVAAAIEDSRWVRIAGPLAEASIREFAALPAILHVPMGTCHGDLTLSNILFDVRDQPHILIDFLDTFVDSPLLDIAKLRQETALAWTSTISSRRHDRAKYMVAMRRLDSMLGEHLLEGRPWISVARALQRQTLLRIFPYCRSDKVAEQIADYLNQL